MRSGTSFLQRHGPRLLAICLVLVLAALTRPPHLSSPERATLASRFNFTPLPLPLPEGYEVRQVRSVHPSLERISAWISSLGAAVALADLDGDGLPNDVCLVDARIDQVVVLPVPGTRERFPLFTLDPGPPLFDRHTMAPMGCLPGDLNEDGRQDLLVYYWGRTPIAFLARAGEDAAAKPLSAPGFRAVEIVPGGERWYTSAATRADLDGDGHLDLVVGNFFPDGSRVLDVGASKEELLLPRSTWRAANGGHNRLLLFREASAGWEPTLAMAPAGDLPTEISDAWTLAVGAADLDDDLLPELYFANAFGPDRLLHNRSRPGELRFVQVEGARRLATPRSKVLGRDSFQGMGVDFADLNGDGVLDLFVSHLAQRRGLEESHLVFVSDGPASSLAQGVAPYSERGQPLGLSQSAWSWEARFGDFDNDGTCEALQATGFVRGRVSRWPELLELAMGNEALLRLRRSWPRMQAGDDLAGAVPNPFYVLSASGRFYDLASPAIGLGEPQVSRGIATADVDGDGDLDFAVANQWESSVFYRNDSPGDGRSLVLDLELPRPRHREMPAIGAAASVRLPDGRLLVGQVDGGNGHSGVRAPGLHFGLGSLPADARLEVELRWRDRGGHIQRLSTSLRPGRYRVTLSAEAPT